MASFTLALKDVIALGGNNRYKAIGLDDYPIFDEAYRETLNENIIRAYLNEEIGTESIAVFRNNMRSRMHLEMPYFNGLYETEKMKVDPLVSVDMSTTSDSKQDSTNTGTSSATTTSNGTTNSEARNFSYPQSQLRSNGEYMSSASQSDSDSASESDADEHSQNTGTASSEGTQVMRGRQQSAAALINEYRATLMNIDSQVVDAISDLFMGVWTNGQSYTGASGSQFGSHYTPYYRGF